MASSQRVAVFPLSPPPHRRVMGRREGEEAKEVQRVTWRHFSLLRLHLSLFLVLACFLSSSLSFSPLFSEQYKGPSHSNAHGNSNRYDALFWKFAGFSCSFSNFAVNASALKIARPRKVSMTRRVPPRRCAAGIFAPEACDFAPAMFNMRIDM